MCMCVCVFGGVGGGGGIWRSANYFLVYLVIGDGVGGYLKGGPSRNISQHQINNQEIVLMSLHFWCL